VLRRLGVATYIPTCLSSSDLLSSLLASRYGLNQICVLNQCIMVATFVNKLSDIGVIDNDITRAVFPTTAFFPPATCLSNAYDDDKLLYILHDSVIRFRSTFMV
jgi:hypothetical protein